MGQHTGLCLGDKWPSTTACDGAQCTSRMRKHLDKQYCSRSAATAEETPRDLPPVRQRGNWQ